MSVVCSGYFLLMEFIGVLFVVGVWGMIFCCCLWLVFLVLDLDMVRCGLCILFGVVIVSILLSV